ncbi:MAG: hypothetical protein U1E22_00210, partial [Coriobacteriia bacterium]|nr:hypothetical protein [Coriobacteriia bacterium]
LGTTNEMRVVAQDEVRTRLYTGVGETTVGGLGPHLQFVVAVKVDHNALTPWFRAQLLHVAKHRPGRKTRNPRKRPFCLATDCSPAIADVYGIHAIRARSETWERLVSRYHQAKPPKSSPLERIYGVPNALRPEVREVIICQVETNETLPLQVRNNAHVIEDDTAPH